MKQTMFAVTFAGTLFAAASGSANAFDPVNDDTDLFLANPAYTVQRPNVLIFLDNTANWNLRFNNEMAALATVFNGLSDQYNVGLMMYTETGAGNGGPDGAYVRAAVRQMTATNATLMADLVTSFDQNGDKGNNATVSLAMHEIYTYFAGVTARAGIKQKRDYAGNSIAGLTASNNIYALPDNALSSAGATQYDSPITDGCQRNILIFISNGAPNDNNSSLSTAEGLLVGLTGNNPPDTIAISPSGQQGNWADEYARFMATADVNASVAGDQHVTTYTIEVDPVTTGQGPATTALFKSMAVNGNGKYFAVDGGDANNIVTAINQILDEVQAVNSVFASSTLPVSVNVRGTNLNQVYIGVFRPDTNKAPRWFGNLKMYKLGVDTATSALFLADANGDPAENPSTGFVAPTAESFWTQGSSFWGYRPASENGVGGDSDLPDGELVEKGGVAQQLRIDHATSQSTRNLYTCTAAAGGYCSSVDNLSSTEFKWSNSDITVADLGVADASERTDLIDWVRGEDQFDENANAQANDIRASVHGDVLHSRPAVINYGRNGPTDENDVYAFYGSNDGVFRAVKGGTGADGGTEVWGFIPREFFGKLKRLRDDAPILSSTDKKPYFVDGSVTIYQEDVNGDGALNDGDGDKVYLYLAMRRGGRLLYALDVSDPEAPALLWRRDNTSAGFAELGQSWSAPTVANVPGYANPVLIMGMGYDATVEDIQPCMITSSDASGVTWTSGGTVTWLPGTCSVSGGTLVTTSRSMGRGVMVVDAFNGNLLWQAGASVSGATHNLTVSGMDYSISSDVAVIDVNSDGIQDTGYVGDNGGNVWRLNFNDNDPANWTVQKLAAVGAHSATDRRKFQYPPDVVFSNDAGGNYNAVLIGSGDREHPFDATVTNRFYLFKDRALATPIGDSDVFDATAATGSNTYGYKITMASGEKVVSSAVTVSGITYFNTNQPSDTAGGGVCGSNLGVARQYSINYQDAVAVNTTVSGTEVTARASIYPGGGYLPSPVPIVVNLNGKNYMGVVSGTSVQTPPTPALDVRSRTFWFIKSR
ncbi:MAG: pilus assembly protein PilY [Betaproteobacteria bacterium]|nr:MAG: pilus assembly protein PilY [Betaproteobacteria bacterium]